VELKSYAHIVRNKLLFQYAPALRPLLYQFCAINERPIIVLGNQKAGTSAIAALLAKATGLSYDIDIAGFRAPEYAALHNGSTSLRSLIKHRARLEFSKGLVKEPGLTFLYGHLRATFPNAKYVLVLRNPFSNIRSTLNRLGLPGDQEVLSTAQIASLSPIWKSILYNEWVGDPTRTDLNYIGRSAERWQQAARVYQNHPQQISLIKYETFNGDKRNVIEALASTLGLRVIRDISSQVDVQFQPRGNKTDNYKSLFGRNYDTILRECASGLSAYYPTLSR